MTTYTVTTPINLDKVVKLGSVAGLTWSRATTTANVTQANHGLVTNDTIYVSATSDAAAITTGSKTITVTGVNNYTFTCLNAGAASGTITAYHNDNYIINGGYLTIDSHTKYGVNQNVNAALGNITMSASLGGTVEINSTKVRIIPYDTGTGNVPALDTVISKGTASGKLLGVYSAINAAPTTAGSAMPASGYIMIRQWNSIAYTSGALTGISANATAADRAGWLEIIATENLTCTINRLNLFKVRGDYYDFLGTTTDGSRTTTYQLPTNGSTTMYCPGVEVETGTGTGVYEFYPCAGSKTALIANIATDAVRGKWCWVGTDGLVRFGHDGTNQTGGYVPLSGCKIRVPNVFLINATAAANATQALPNATLATRYEFATTGGGVIDIDKACVGWYLNCNQPYSISLTNTNIFTVMVLTECASPIAWSNVGIGQEAANTQIALTMSLNLAGGTMDKCTWTRAAQAATGTYIQSWNDCLDFTITNERNHSLTKAASGTSGTNSLTRVSRSTWTNTTIGGGRIFCTTTTDVKYKDSIYYDHPATTTGTSTPMYAFEIGTNCVRTTFDGLTFGGLDMVQPYSGILSILAAGCTETKLRNIGTPASPLSMGAAPVYGQAWTRSTSTATMTGATGLKTGDIIYVLISSDTGAITVGAKTMTAATTFACLNAGAASGTLSYYPTMAGVICALATSAAAADVRLQRLYCPHTRGTSGLLTGDNSSKNIVIDDVWVSHWSAQLVPELNASIRHIQATPALTAQTSVYGSHFIDYYIADPTPNLASVSWSRTTTTATVTSTGHKLYTGMLINVTVTSDSAAIVVGQKTITATTADAFTFTCLNAGGASGTLTFVSMNSRISVQMNEPTTVTASQVSLVNTAAFTSAGGLYMPVIGDQATFTPPENIIGHTGYPIAEPVMAGGTLSNYDVTYSLDSGTTYKNLSYPRYVTPFTINAVASTYPKIIKLNSTQCLMVWVDSTFVKMTILNYSSGLITSMGATYVGPAASYPNVIRLTDTTALLAYAGTSNYLTTCILTITGNYIEMGSLLLVNAVSTTYIALAAMSSTQAICSYIGTSSFVQACTLNIDGNGVLTNGTVLTVNATASSYVAITALSSTQALIAYRGTSTFTNACTLDVSGTTLTNGTVLAVNAVASTYMSIDKLTSTTAILSYVGTTSYVQACVLSVSGTTVTNGTVVSVNAAASTWVTVAAATSTEAVVAWTDSTSLKAAVLTITSGTTVSAGTLKTVSASAALDKWIVPLTSTQMIIGYSGNTAYLQARFLDISGTTISSIADSVAAGTTLDFAQGIGDVATGQYVFGTGIALNATVQSISGNTVTLDKAHTGVVIGTARFNNLPNETIADASVGISPKIRIKTTTGNLTAITSLAVVTTSTTASRAYTYPLDVVPISITVKDASTLSVIQDARVFLVAGAGGPAVEGTVILNTLTNVSGIVSNSKYSYVGSQPVTGRVRKGSSSPLYRTSPITGTITSSGLDVTVFLVKDE